jgi:ABC-type multidrug transport system ATPase subunit
MIVLNNISKHFGSHPVLRGVSLTVEPGQSVALWGANGAGKTTIIRCICGLYDYGGSIRVGSFDARAQPKQARQCLGYVPQSCGLSDDLRVAEAVRFFATLRGVTEVDVKASLSQVGLLAHAAKSVGQLSGGMKQRLALAIAQIGAPPVLLLDEVTANLDATGRREMIDLLSDRAGKLHRTLLFASHRLDEIAALASRVVVLEAGVVAKDLTVAAFLASQAPDLVLHLFMNRDDALQAIPLLTTHGFSPRINGRGIFVPVRSGDRIGPIRLLQQKNLEVNDFEVLDTHPSTDLA